MDVLLKIFNQIGVVGGLALSNVLLLLCLFIRNRVVRRCREKANAVEESLKSSLEAVEASMQSSLAETKAVSASRENQLKQQLSSVESKYQETFSRYKNRVVERYRLRIEQALESSQRLRLEYKLLFLLSRQLNDGKLRALEQAHQADIFRYKDIAEVEALNVEFWAEHNRIERKLSSVSERLLALKATYADKKYIYNRLVRKISEYEEDLEFMEYGVYKLGNDNYKVTSTTITLTG